MSILFFLFAFLFLRFFFPFSFCFHVFFLSFFLSCLLIFIHFPRYFDSFFPTFISQLLFPLCRSLPQFFFFPPFFLPFLFLSFFFLSYSSPLPPSSIYLSLSVHYLSIYLSIYLSMFFVMVQILSSNPALFCRRSFFFFFSHNPSTLTSDERCHSILAICVPRGCLFLHVTHAPSLMRVINTSGEHMVRTESKREEGEGKEE
ncbi:unnamed protein product [Acanthosepion pharaonis]|uniref:Uncharacterized protein n=1 Tax=Acanthosepion pharaonis TaxID=158019 RepID=A0A812C1A5_ACAPH|nr:unnamed protein product [Sepia pharaonis]